jgi:hypothetical protein
MNEEKRLRLPLWVKLDAALLLLGLDPKAVEWHHEPPLKLRPWTGEDYDPPQHDPKHIVPLPIIDHRERTATTDIPAIAKTNRLMAAQLEFRTRLLARKNGEPLPPSKWRSRPFQRKPE